MGRSPTRSFGGCGARTRSRLLHSAGQTGQAGRQAGDCVSSLPCASAASLVPCGFFAAVPETHQRAAGSVLPCVCACVSLEHQCDAVLCCAWRPTAVERSGTTARAHTLCVRVFPHLFLSVLFALLRAPLAASCCTAPGYAVHCTAAARRLATQCPSWRSLLAHPVLSYAVCALDSVARRRVIVQL